MGAAASEQIADRPAASEMPRGASNDGIEDTDADANACPICLEAMGTSRAVLSCGHSFCFECVRRYRTECCKVGADATDRPYPCPCCRQPVLFPHQSDDLDYCVRRAMRRRMQTERDQLGWTPVRPSEPRQTVDSRLHHARIASATRPPLPEDTRRDTQLRRTRIERRTHIEHHAPRAPLPEDALRELRQAVGRSAEIRFCPSCQSPIVKNGGCDNVRCTCLVTFKWSKARPLQPCGHCHGGPFLSAKTCQHCSKMARAEACARRSVGALVVAPVASAAVASALAITVAVVLVPVALFTGPALIYEPIRRVRKKRDNPFADAAVSGGIVCISATCGYDSD